MDIVSQSVTVTAGDEVADVSLLDTETDIPDTLENHLELAAVRLFTGQERITENKQTTDILDLRWPQNAVTGSITDTTARWEPVTNGDPVVPELVYDHEGDVLMNLIED
jgi:hypothetical protein